MRKILLNLFLLLLIVSDLAAQKFICGVENSNNNLFIRKGGKYIISVGEVRALVVFVQFSDDSLDSPLWPLTVPPSLPKWSNQIIGMQADNIGISGERKFLGISDYFYEMSGGLYQVMGDVFPEVYVPEYSEDYYIQNGGIAELNKEILTNINPYVDFSQYDNCGSEENIPDGVVDMIFLIYRNFSDALINNKKWMATSGLILDEDLRFDGVTIKKGFGHHGSGVVIRNAKNGFRYTLFAANHEYAHYLFGASHLENTGTLSLMNEATWRIPRGMHAVERERLDWFDYCRKTEDDIVYMSDYYSTGKACIIPVYNDLHEIKEYYLITNRQKRSKYDGAGDRGIYIYYVNNLDRELPSVKVLCADGNWHFTFDVEQRKITRDFEERFGTTNEMNYKINFNDSVYACLMPYYHENAAWGDDEDAFDLNFNNVFSPVSNPNSRNSEHLNFTVEVTEKFFDTYKINLYFSNPYEGRPSKVVNFKTSFSEDIPSLVWNANLEPDLLGYRVCKKLYFSDETTRTYYFFVTDTFYYDYEFELLQNNSEVTQVEYWVSAIDTSGKASLESEHKDLILRGNSENELLANANKKTSLPVLLGNYPNPFNPTTTIKYTIPRIANVEKQNLHRILRIASLRIYNILGKEVATLVNKKQSPGTYAVRFDASHLPSGVYFYTLRIGDFVTTKKMLLLK